MNSPKTLEINGNLTAHPLAELLVEALASRLHGSLRVSHHDSKTIIYLKNGEVVFAVSNQRRHRLFELLLQNEFVTKQQLVEIPDFTNDFALAGFLKQKRIFPETRIDTVVKRQVEAILDDVASWKEGIWTFSPLARIKDDIHYPADVYSLLIEYGRKLPKDAVVRRFKSFKESFGRKPTVPSHINLLPQEAFLLSRFEDSYLKIEEIKDLCQWSDVETLQRLYALWLAGFLYRENWDPAFKEHQLSAITAAKFELKKQTAAPAEIKSAAKPAAPETPVPAAPAKIELTLEEYLAHAEAAETHYEMLNVSHRADANEIKQAYFNLAKRFHPDLYQKQTNAENLRRIQHAFTEIAHAYEVLRDEEKRKNYDFKLRRLLDELEKLSPAERRQSKPTQKALTEASEIFEYGFSLLIAEEYEQAMPYISRAVHLAPDNARYHAYYGKLLAADKNQRFKAEAELQTAVKLDPDNAELRFMLAEFFIQYNLLKRAEGELNRLLAISPNHREARALLDSLR